MRSWKEYQDCIKSVQDACLTDIYTGGIVKYFNFDSKIHNIPLTQTPLSNLFNLLKERGFVMRKHTKQPSTMAEPIKTAINDPDIFQDLNSASSNINSFEAPAPEAMIEWQEDEIQELSDFFLRCK